MNLSIECFPRGRSRWRLVEGNQAEPLPSDINLPFCLPPPCLPPLPTFANCIFVDPDSCTERTKAAMGSKKERLWSRAWRAAKALFFVANMLASLLLDCAPPLLVVVIDLLLPFAFFVAAGGKGPALASELRNYRFRASLVDLPLVSAARSIFILCLYLCFSGRGPYLGLATLCASMSAGYVSLKAIAMFGAASSPGKRRLLSLVSKEGPAVEVLLLSSLALAVGHVVAAYRTSCRERRRLLVYKIDIEAVSAYNNGFTNYHKLAVSK